MSVYSYSKVLLSCLYEVYRLLKKTKKVDEYFPAFLPYWKSLPPSLICIKYIKQPKGKDRITPIKYVFCLPSPAEKDKKFLLD